MPPKKPCAQLGCVEERPDAYRAHVQVRNEWGHKEHLYGPHRRVKHRADADLTSIRAAAEGWSSRVDEVEAMKKETRRLQRQREFEARVAMEVDQCKTRRVHACSQPSGLAPFPTQVAKSHSGIPESAR